MRYNVLCMSATKYVFTDIVIEAPTPAAAQNLAVNQNIPEYYWDAVEDGSDSQMNMVMAILPDNMYTTNADWQAYSTAYVVDVDKLSDAEFLQTLRDNRD